MNRFVRWLLSGSAAAIAAWSVIYFIAHFSSAPFAEGAMGNLFATILGVLVGVPIALELSRRQQEAAQVAAANERQIHETERKRKVLGLLRLELADNRDGIIKRRQPIDSGGKREVYTQSLRDQMWSAFSDGGELQYVNSPEVLGSLANAYHEIRHCIMLEHKMLDAIHFPGMRIQQTKTPEDYILGYLTDSDPSLLATVEATLLAIDAELKLLGAPK